MPDYNGSRKPLLEGNEQVTNVDHYVLTGNTSVTAGGTVTFTVTAFNSQGNKDTLYSGTVEFFSNDPQATLPAPATLTFGAAVFTATLKTAGNITIDAQDTLNSNPNGSLNVLVIPAVVSFFVLHGWPTTTTAGVAISGFVTAFDSYGNVATNYLGTIHFTSTDGAAVLPSDSTLISGNGAFSATLNTSGNRVITATDTTTPAVTGSTPTIVVSGSVFQPSYQFNDKRNSQYLAFGL